VIRKVDEPQKRALHGTASHLCEAVVPGPYTLNSQPQSRYDIEVAVPASASVRTVALRVLYVGPVKVPPTPATRNPQPSTLNPQPTTLNSLI